jgi:S-adenosyl methyltransferase
MSKLQQRQGGVSVDGTAATVHGLYNYWLHGGQHLHADRELGKSIEEEFPSVPAHVRAAKGFHLRTARWCAERGIARFVRARAVTWQPDGRNVHDAAREANPAAQVVYVNADAEAHDWAKALLADGPGVAAVHAAACRPAEVLAAPPVAAFVASGAPVCLIIGMVLHFAAAEAAAAQVAAYAAALPSGSVLAVSLSLLDRSPRTGRLVSMFTPAQVHRHTAEDVARWLERAGLDLVPPGVRNVRLVPGDSWAAAVPPPRAPEFTVGALGLVP